MGDSFHKRRKSGGKLTPWRMKRKFELGRQPSETKIGHKRIRTLRTRGGNTKYRALRLDAGNFSWASESTTRKTRLLNVVYNSTNNELVRTNTLVKSCVVQIDAAPFKQWYEQHYGIKIGKKKGDEEDKKNSNHVDCKLKKRQATRVLLKSSRPSLTQVVSLPRSPLVQAKVAGVTESSSRVLNSSSTCHVCRRRNKLTKQ